MLPGSRRRAAPTNGPSGPIVKAHGRAFAPMLFIVVPPISGSKLARYRSQALRGAGCASTIVYCESRMSSSRFGYLHASEGKPKRENLMLTLLTEIVESWHNRHPSEPDDFETYHWMQWEMYHQYIDGTWEELRAADWRDYCAMNGLINEWGECPPMR